MFDRRLSTLKSVCWMLVVAVSVRLIVAGLMIDEHLNPARDHWKFGWEMGRVARSICDGHGFSAPFGGASGPTALMPPVYPYLIAACMKLFGRYTAASTFAILTLNSIFASATIIPVYLLSKRLLGARTAIVTGWTWALFPYSIYLSAGRIWEFTLTCMIASFIWLQTLRLQESQKIMEWLLWGGLWGLAAMVSPALLGPLPFLGLWLVVRRYRARLTWFLPALSSAVVFLALIAPWTLRNYHAFHRLVPLRDGFWLEVHVGNNGDTSDVEPYSAHPSTNAAEYRDWVRLGEIGYLDAKKAESESFIRQHPLFFAWMSLRHFTYTWTGFWSLDARFLAAEPFHIPNVLFTTTMTALMLTGLAYLWRDGNAQAALPLVIILATFPVVYYITHPSMDYRHPIDPVIVPIACYGVLSLLGARAKNPTAARQAAQAVDGSAERITDH